MKRIIALPLVLTMLFALCAGLPRLRIAAPDDPVLPPASRQIFSVFYDAAPVRTDRLNRCIR